MGLARIVAPDHQRNGPRFPPNGARILLRMARLPKGVAPTPRKLRQQGYRDNLKRRGGRRVNVELEAEAAEALQRIEDARRVSAKAAVSEAVIQLAATLPQGPR